MKYFLHLLSLFSFTLLASDEYPYIQPISVEQTTQLDTAQIIDLNQVKSPQTKKVKIDTDGDGVIDELDKCQKTSKKFIVDNYGCPQTLKLLIHYDVNSSEIDTKYLQNIKTLTKFLQENPNYQVVIYGYSDFENPDNKLLAKKRAKSVKSALIEEGISSTKLTAIGKTQSFKNKQGNSTHIEIELIQ